jgi:phage FluMu protein Com
MTETPDLIACPRCKKPLLRSAVRGHLESCSKEKKIDKKKEKVNGDTNGEPSTNKKKRKLDDGKAHKF